MVRDNFVSVFDAQFFVVRNFEVLPCYFGIFKNKLLLAPAECSLCTARISPQGFDLCESLSGQKTSFSLPTLFSAANAAVSDDNHFYYLVNFDLIIRCLR